MSRGFPLNIDTMSAVFAPDCEILPANSLRPIPPRLNRSLSGKTAHKSRMKERTLLDVLREVVINADGTSLTALSMGNYSVSSMTSLGSGASSSSIVEATMTSSSILGRNSLGSTSSSSSSSRRARKSPDTL